MIEKCMGISWKRTRLPGDPIVSKTLWHQGTIAFVFHSSERQGKTWYKNPASAGISEGIQDMMWRLISILLAMNTTTARLWRGSPFMSNELCISPWRSRTTDLFSKRALVTPYIHILFCRATFYHMTHRNFDICWHSRAKKEHSKFSLYWSILAYRYYDCHAE